MEEIANQSSAIQVIAIRNQWRLAVTIHEDVNWRLQIRQGFDRTEVEIILMRVVYRCIAIALGREPGRLQIYF
jgi:hypothetical protein